jgi:hypothetical protein
MDFLYFPCPSFVPMTCVMSFQIFSPLEPHLLSEGGGALQPRNAVSVCQGLGKRLRGEQRQQRRRLQLSTISPYLAVTSQFCEKNRGLQWSWDPRSAPGAVDTR